MAGKNSHIENCFHCGQICNAKEAIYSDDHIFCCQGCQAVYSILQSSGLENYYALNSHPGKTGNENPRPGKYTFLNEPRIADEVIRYRNEDETQVVLYLPQIHCSSCLWLLERMHHLHPGIKKVRVNFARKEAAITFDHQTICLQEVAELLAKIGYEPVFSTEINSGKNTSSRQQLLYYRLGVAGFCFANIMMFSLPEYFSFQDFFDQENKLGLRYLTLLLALPVFFFCAIPFFKGAWSGLKNKVVNIDAPIALAIALTFFRSLYNIFILNESAYFDSMSGIVFFMLLGRWAQQKTENHLRFDRDYASFFPLSVGRKTKGVFKQVLIRELNQGDIIEVFQQEIIPADSLLQTANAMLDYSFVTGESYPVKVSCGQKVFAGAKSIGGRIELVVEKKVSENYLLNLWNSVSSKTYKQQSGYVNALSKWFTIAVLVLTVTGAFYWWMNDDPVKMWNVLSTTLIIACPCALLLAATYTQGFMLRLLDRHQLFLKNGNVMADMADVTDIVFDKTGTLTQFKNTEVEYEGRGLSGMEKRQLAAILHQSKHPLGSAVLETMDMEEKDIALNYFEQHTGKGVMAEIGGAAVKVGSAAFVGEGERFANCETEGGQVYIKFNSDVAGKFVLRSAFREGYNEVLENLKNNYTIHVLTGDNEAARPQLQEILGRDASLHFYQTPYDKVHFIENLQQNGKKVMMIGDGLNDAGALQQSNVGLVITENINNFVPAADGIFDASFFNRTYDMMRYAKTSRRIIAFTFFVSAVYNVVGLYFALQGILSPLVAAILMPLSSLTIILITYSLTSYYGNKYGFLRSGLITQSQRGI